MTPLTREAAPKDRPIATTAAAKRRVQSYARVGRHVAPTPPRVVGSAVSIRTASGSTYLQIVYRCPSPSCHAFHRAVVRGPVPELLRRRGPHGIVEIVLAYEASVVAA